MAKLCVVPVLVAALAVVCQLRETLYVEWQDAVTSLTLAEIYQSNAEYAVELATEYQADCQDDLTEHLAWDGCTPATCAIAEAMGSALIDANLLVEEKEQELDERSDDLRVARDCELSARLYYEDHLTACPICSE